MLQITAPPATTSMVDQLTEILVGLSAIRWLLVRPAVGADRGAVAAPVIAAVDQDAANAEFAHFAEGDLGGAGGHA